MLSAEEYEELASGISNDEVPEMIFRILANIHEVLERDSKLFTEELHLQYGMFKLFFKQYNTILQIAQGLEYLYSSDISYIDLRSVYTLSRSLQELYLTYNYLCYDGIFEAHDRDNEKSFKWLSFKYAGCCDALRTHNLMKKNTNQVHYELGSDGHLLRKKQSILQEIKKNTVYMSLSKELKKDIKEGRWKINSKKKLSWADLLEYTPIQNLSGKSDYHVQSQYAHASYGALMLESQHDYDPEGLLCHLYKISSLFSLTVLVSFEKNIFDEEILTSRELALLFDFQAMAYYH